MNILYAAYIAAGVLAALSVLCAVLNWVSAARTSARVAELEKEIEKKALEFDALRRERASGVVVAAVDPSPAAEGPIAMAQPPITDGAHEPGTDTSEIQIFRNVRGAFAQSQPSVATGAPPAPVVAPETPYAIQEQPPPLAVSAPPVQPVFGPRPVDGQAAAGPQGDERGEVLDVVAEDAAGDTGATPSSGLLRVRVFSEARKDADFDAMGRELRDRFPRAPNPRVVLDFSGVYFLYEQELEYLVRVERFIRSRNGTLSLVRCEGELRATLLKHPVLAACMKC